jgi:hypothetical protein
MQNLKANTPGRELVEFELKAFDGRESDYHFVLSGWLESFKKHGYVVGMPKQRYFEAYRPLVINIVKNSKVVFAVAKDDPDLLYGFIVYRLIGSVPVISFCYVKHFFRKLGIGGSLIEHALNEGSMDPRSGFCTHTFKWLDERLKKYNLIYDPFLDLKFLQDERKTA